jgi:hypothetical protein
MTVFFSLALLLSFAISAGLVWQLYKLQQSLQQREREGRRMQQDLQGLIQCMHGVRERFEKQQKQLRNVSILQNDIAAKNSNDSNFQQATLLRDKGATVEELVETCGLSQGEAELINHLSDLNYETAMPMAQAGLR